MIHSPSQIALRLRESEQQAQQQKERVRQQNRQHLLQNSEARRNEQRAAAQPAAAQRPPSLSQSARSSESRRPGAEDRALFSALLAEEDVITPRLALEQGSDQQQGSSQLEAPSPSGAPPAMALWREIEPVLAGALMAPPPGEMVLTLMLPKLGNVQAQMAALPGGGWDIALHLQPAAWHALLPHQERCRFSLRQRMACRVSLRFERGLGREPEVAL